MWDCFFDGRQEYENRLRFSWSPKSYAMSQSCQLSKKRESAVSSVEKKYQSCLPVKHNYLKFIQLKTQLETLFGSFLAFSTINKIAMFFPAMLEHFPRLFLLPPKIPLIFYCTVMYCTSYCWRAGETIFVNECNLFNTKMKWNCLSKLNLITCTHMFPLKTTIICVIHVLPVCRYCRIVQMYFLRTYVIQ